MASADDGVEFLRHVSETDSLNRSEGLEDLRFRYGDQWPVEIQNSRQLEARPMLTINETDAYLRKIENQQRQQRPRMNPHPVGSKASIEVAKVLKGLCRHIEVNSDADNAYDLAFSFALTNGWGYYRLHADYSRPDSFDQDIYIDQVENPFSVYFDPNSTLPDGSDAEKCLITDKMRKDTFRKLFPDADDGSGFTERATGDTYSDTTWVTKDDIRLAEYMHVERVKDELLALSDGSIVWGSKVKQHDLLTRFNIRVTGSRPSFRKTVKWQKQTQFEVLQERDIPGMYIPVVPVYGIHVRVDDKVRKFGLVRFAKDPQRMVNFWQTTFTEKIASMPKAKWLIAEGTDEGHENEYAQANTKNTAVLRYKTTGVDGKEAQPPIYIQPEQPPQGVMEAAFMAGENLKRLLGVYDPQVKTDGNKSGKAIQAEKMQSEESSYNFYDNLTRSIKHGGRIILGWVPTYYDRQRVSRIIGEDGKPDMVTLNQRGEPGQDGITKILNDVTVAEYDIVMDTGPGYNTKRAEAFDAFTALMAGPMGEIVAQAGADLVVRLIDAPGMETLADRLAAANPLSEIDEQSDIPPHAQMMIKSLQAKLEQAGQQMQQMGDEIKSRQSIAEIREHGATIREKMKQEGDAKERQITQAQKQHDTETFALTSQNVAEINGLVKLLTSKTEHGHRLREMLQEFQHATALQDKQLAAKSSENETIQ